MRQNLDSTKYNSLAFDNRRDKWVAIYGEDNFVNFIEQALALRIDDSDLKNFFEATSNLLAKNSLHSNLEALAVDLGEVFEFTALEKQSFLNNIHNFQLYDFARNQVEIYQNRYPLGLMIELFRNCEDIGRELNYGNRSAIIGHKSLVLKDNIKDFLDGNNNLHDFMQILGSFFERFNEKRQVRQKIFGLVSEVINADNLQVPHGSTESSSSNAERQGNRLSNYPKNCCKCLAFLSLAFSKKSGDQSVDSRDFN